MIHPNVILTVGNTPMVELGRVAKGLPGRVVAKLEMRNPCGSVKDRVGVALIEDAERRGILRPGVTLVEATGGNTGVGLAFAAAIRGYRLILTMPETMSVERIALLRHLGAEVISTPGILMGDAVTRAKQLLEEIPGAINLDQFKNPANPEAHRRTTATSSAGTTPSITTSGSGCSRRTTCTTGSPTPGANSAPSCLPPPMHATRSGSLTSCRSRRPCRAPCGSTCRRRAPATPRTKTP